VAVHALYKWFPDQQRTLPTAVLTQGAEIVLIPERSRDEADQFLERFYSANDPGVSTTLVLEELAQELRELAGDIPVPGDTSIIDDNGR
jgi:hypothetical protein